MKRALWMVIVLPVLLCAQKPQLLRRPAISRTQVVFSFAGDLWIAPRDGGDARRLTSGPGIETDPYFSPDGSTIAFTGEYDGNVDVYTIPAAGGVPKRLTYHPGADTVVGWTPDGKSVIFRSIRNATSPGLWQLFTLPAGGEGLPAELPLPTAFIGVMSADAKRIAYVPWAPANTSWKNYAGGRTTPIWIANLSDSKIEDRVPRENSNDYEPMWLGGKLYFLSDRKGSMTLYSYDPASKKVMEAVNNTGFDIKSASAGPDAIVYEQFGGLFLYDGKKSKPITIRVTGDLPEVRPKFVNAATSIASFNLSPTGARAVFEARGEVVTVPAEKGDQRNITNTVAAHDRAPAWSPDSKWIAYFSDGSGEYQLEISDASGKSTEVKKINLGEASFFYSPVWSPDSKKISYADRRLNYWYVDVEKGKPVKIDTDYFGFSGIPRTPTWSPDSRWVAYPKLLKNHLHAIYVYDLQDAKVHQVTDGMSDANFPAWDKNGKYLYFTASTDAGPTLGPDLSTFARTSTDSIYVAVLRKDLPSPLAPESDEEKAPDAAKPDAAKPDDAKKDDAKKDDAKKPEPPKAAEPVKIDFDDFDQRILALPMPARSYTGLWTGKAGVLYFREPAPPSATPGPQLSTIQKHDLNTRKTEKVLDGAGGFTVSFNGEKMMWSAGPRYFIQGTAAPVKPGEGALKTDPMDVWIDPPAEWREMYHEGWRNQRDFFYDPGHHGLNIADEEKRYQPFVEGLGSRDDLNYLFAEMFGELRVSHLFVRGGMLPDVKRVGGGLLGADYVIEGGRYKIAKIYQGESWNPDLRAPLTQPGVNVKAGEFLLAVGGRELRATDNLYSFFENKANRQVTIKVGPNADGAGSREVVVTPIANEGQLRFRSWIEANRKKVYEMTGGKVAYVYLPDTANGGYSFFNRYFFSQVDKQAVIVDERYNGGGALADYVVDYLGRQLMNLGRTRNGADFTVPQMAIYGPKVMIINEMAGSGGDAMPYYFRRHGLGPLIGTRTWGGLVAAASPPPLLDGGSHTSPDGALWTADGKWLAENQGVAPDIMIEQDPAAVRAGHDPQLEKAVAVVLDLMKTNPGPVITQPSYKDLKKRPN